MSRPFVTENVFRALAHVRRRRVLELLQKKRKLRPIDLIQAIGLTGPALSQHLRTLRQSGLVTCRRSGTTLVYQINRAAVRDAATWLAAISKSN
jgi:DNA-binding transcriptional ArsR family regulator